MYKIYLRYQGEDYPLYEPLDDELRVFSPVLTQEMGRSGQLEFYMLANHPNADKLGLLKTEIFVYDDGREIYRGRILKPNYTMENLIAVTCEGDYTYLIDSQQKPFEMECDIPTFLTRMLETHNSQVDDYKKMYLGTVTVTGNSSSPITWKSTKYTTTLDILNAQIAKVYGGYFRTRNVNGKKYLDLLWDYGGINEQVVRYGINLLELDARMDASSIVTCLIPLGADVEYQDDLGEMQVKTVDISSVNQGVNYIQDDAAVARFGKVWGSYKWSDIKEPADLLAKAKKYLQEVSALPVSIEANVMDLSFVDSDETRLELGYWTQVISRPHGIDQKLLLTKRVINLLDPTAGSITLGKPPETFVDKAVNSQQAASEAVDKVAESTSAEIKRKVENATNLITGGLGGYVVLDNVDPNTGEKIHPWRILIMNTPDKETAKNVIQFNQNGIGFSTTGINGPYANAWTIDGNLVADFITSGTMLADRIRGGILEVGGAGLARDGSITVKNTDGTVIGTWDKTGLHVLLGVIEGSTIKGSNIIGGRINIGNGTFEVDSDGAVEINSGEIHIGNVDITEQYAWMYGFGISDTVLYSRDSGTSVQIITKDDEYGNGPAVELKKGSISTRIGYGGIVTGDISFSDSWTEGMTAIDMFKDLYYRTNSLKQRIEDLEG